MCAARVRQVRPGHIRPGISLTRATAEFRGPGVRHSFDHDSPDEYDLDISRNSRGFGGRNGRIILLGDGTEVLTDSIDDSEMFDHSMDDQDEENQIKKGDSTNDASDPARNEREDTPGPVDKTEPKESDHHDASHGPATSIKGVSDGPAKS